MKTEQRLGFLETRSTGQAAAGLSIDQDRAVDRLSHMPTTISLESNS